MRSSLFLAALALPLLLSPAQAQHAGGHGGHGANAAAPAASAESAATKAYREANARMHKEMDIAYTGDADIDFLKSMIPHHQGALDMARVALAHGKDPKVRKLAQDVVKAQEAEIALMRQWLKERGH